MRSASRSASSRYCVVSSSAAPSSTRPRIASHIRRGSRGRGRSWARRGTRRAGGRPGRRRGPAAAACRRSSRSGAVGGVRRARSARAARRCARGRSRGSAAAAGRAGRFSRPVRRSSSVACWPASAIGSRTAAGSRTTSRPSTKRGPLGPSSVAKMRTAVVLPAPLWPSSQSTVPASTRGPGPPARWSGRSVTRPSATTAGVASYGVRSSYGVRYRTLYGMSGATAGFAGPSSTARARAARGPLAAPREDRPRGAAGVGRRSRAGCRLHPPAWPRELNSGRDVRSITTSRSRDELPRLMAETVGGGDAGLDELPGGLAGGADGDASAQPRHVQGATRGCWPRSATARA